MSFLSSGNEVVVVNSHGNLGLGLNGQAPQGRLHVSGSVLIGDLGVVSSVSQPDAPLTIVADAQFDDTLRIVSANGDPVFVIRNDGHIGIFRNPTDSYQLAVSGNIATDRLGILNGNAVSDLNSLVTWETYTPPNHHHIFYNKDEIQIDLS